MTDDFQTLQIRPVVGAEDRRHVTLEYLSGCTPDVPDRDFDRDYLQISGYVPLKYQPLLVAAPDLLKALKLFSQQTVLRKPLE